MTVIALIISALVMLFRAPLLRLLFGTIEDERFPLPVIIPLCLSGDGIDTVTWDNFGKEVKLYLYERRTE